MYSHSFSNVGADLQKKYNMLILKDAPLQFGIYTRTQPGKFVII